MRLQIISLALVISSNLLALETFTIVSDTKVKVHGEVFKGSCEQLEEKEKTVNEESGLLGAIKNGLSGLKKEITEKDCNTVGPITLAAKRGTTRSQHKILAGQRAVLFKDISGAEALIPAICFADISKSGRYLVLQTPKSETARGYFGKSMGYGLICTQVENLP